MRVFSSQVGYFLFTLSVTILALVYIVDRTQDVLVSLTAAFPIASVSLLVYDMMITITTAIKVHFVVTRMKGIN